MQEMPRKWGSEYSDARSDFVQLLSAVSGIRAVEPSEEAKQILQRLAEPFPTAEERVQELREKGRQAGDPKYGEDSEKFLSSYPETAEAMNAIVTRANAIREQILEHGDNGISQSDVDVLKTLELQLAHLLRA